VAPAVLAHPVVDLMFAVQYRCRSTAKWQRTPKEKSCRLVCNVLSIIDNNTWNRLTGVKFIYLFIYLFIIKSYTEYMTETDIQ